MARSSCIAGNNTMCEFSLPQFLPTRDACLQTHTRDIFQPLPFTSHVPGYGKGRDSISVLLGICLSSLRIGYVELFGHCKCECFVFENSRPMLTKVRENAFVAMLTIGVLFSTIYLGQHFIIDLVAGASVAAACVLVVTRVRIPESKMSTSRKRLR